MGSTSDSGSGRDSYRVGARRRDRTDMIDWFLEQHGEGGSFSGIPINTSPSSVVRASPARRTSVGSFTIAPQNLE